MPFQFPLHHKYLALLRKNISSLSYVLGEGHTFCLQYLNAGTQHSYTCILHFNEAIFESTSTGKGKDFFLLFIKLVFHLFCKMWEKRRRSENRRTNKMFSRLLSWSQCIERAQLLCMPQSKQQSFCQHCKEFQCKFMTYLATEDLQSQPQKIFPYYI